MRIIITISFILILLNACESRDSQTSSETDNAPQDQTVAGDIHPDLSLSEDMRRGDQDISPDLSADAGSLAVDMAMTSVPPDLELDMERISDPSLDMLIRFEDDPVFTAEAPEMLTVPAGQTRTYQIPILLTQLAQSIQGWSFTLIAHPRERCRLVGVSAEDSWAASVDDDPPGIVDQGLNDTRLIQTSEGPVVLSAVIFSFQERILLSPNQINRPLIQVNLEADAPEVGQRAECLLSTAPQALVEGQTVDQVVVWEGQSLPLFFLPITIELTAEE